MNESCMMHFIAPVRPEVRLPGFGRISRLLKTRGQCPDACVRQRRVGEGRPRRGALLALLAMTLPGLTAASGAQAASAPEWTTFHDARIEQHSSAAAGEKEQWLVIRYLAPEIARDGGSKGYEEAVAAMDALCEGPGLATVRAYESPVQQIVVTLMDRIVEWGEATPEATQFIATYAVTEAGCEWQ